MRFIEWTHVESIAEQIQGLRERQNQWLHEIEAAPLNEIPRLRIRLLGRGGELRAISRALGGAEPEARREIGRVFNEINSAVESALKEREAELGSAPQEEKAGFDFSLPGRPAPRGRLHPLTQTIEAIKDILIRLGFEVAFGPEVERDYYNFEALNVPKDHPARDAFDTFFLHDDVLLRSQTSTVQIRVMEKRRPPLRVIAPGRVYRPDTVDAMHGFLFHQIEGLAVEEGVTMADLKYVLHEFARGLYGPDVRTRFRPSFFPFTEPSVEMDISCFACGGQGCPICKRGGWIEILGAGMVDPNVFQCVGYDSERYTGFAFGMGVERVAMFKYGIDDMRLFLENDLRFLRQF
jgi:phenylalanyl-tRNA synthetase alpha chain